MKIPGRLNLHRQDTETGDRQTLQAQLTAQLRRMIRSGELQAGERLPSTRELSRQLLISRNTVVTAYEMLMGEGYLEAEPRSGFRVNEAAMAFGAIPARHGAVRERPQKPGRPSAPVPFRPTQPDVRLFPLSIWNRHRMRMLKRGPRLLHYQSRFPVGLDELRRSVADYLHDSRGVRCDWRQVAITNGSQQGLFLLASLLLKAGDRVLMEDPGYPGARAAWKHVGATVIPAPIDSEGMRLPKHERLEAALVYVTPSHQFPLGMCMSLTRRLALLRAAQTDGAWIVEDDYDSEFRYTSAPQPSLQSLDEGHRVIYLGSFSKTLFPALRMGYVVLPTQLVEGFAALKSVMDDFSPLVDQATLAAFLDGGAFHAHLRRCRRHYAERQALFLDRVKHHGLPLEFSVTGRGMNLAGLLSDGSNDATHSRALRTAGLDIPALSSYGMKGTPPGLLFGLAGFDLREIQRGVEMMAHCMSQRSRS